MTPRRRSSGRPSGAGRKRRSAAIGNDRIYAFADQLARGQEQPPAEPPEEPVPWLTFAIGTGLFALPVTDLQEILPVGDITPVPRAPFSVRGITNLRGHTVPVVDVALRLGLETSDPTGEERIVITASRGRLIGLLVDAVHEVEPLLPSRVRPRPARLPTKQRPCVCGAYRLRGRRIQLLELTALLTLPEPSPAAPSAKRRGQRRPGKKAQGHGHRRGADGD